jgi:hypothetical protein
MTAKVAVFLPWWGPSPGWERQFLLRTTDIEALMPVLVGDAAAWVPEVRVVRIPCTMDEFQRRASEVSGIAIHKYDPRYIPGQLVCELCPLMADVYQEIIQDYPWWGYGDWDVVWGDWDSFLNDGILSQFDAISTNGATVNGPLQLFKNTPSIVRLYQDRPDMVRCPTGDYHLGEAGMESIVRNASAAGRMRCLYAAGINAHDRHEVWNRCVLRGKKLYRMDEQGNVGGEILKFHFVRKNRWPLS